MNIRTTSIIVCAALAAFSNRAWPAEITVRNDSLNDFGTAVIVSGFTANERAASWLTTPCAGNVRAVQIFWRSQSGATAPIFGERIDILRAGTFPIPGVAAQSILGPVLSDGVLNEYRFLDENNTVPVFVPVIQNETFVVSLDFDTAPPPVGPSVVRDVDGCQAGRNAIYAELGPGSFVWFSSCMLGVAGDWVIRAVVDCTVGGTANLSATKTAGLANYVAGQALTYTITISNAGPSAVVGATVADTFAAAVGAVSWMCTATGGGACPTPSSGLGNINALVNLPVGASAVFTAQGTVAAGTTSPITNTVTVVGPVGVSDPDFSNNLGSVTVTALIDPVFGNGFEAP